MNIQIQNKIELNEAFIPGTIAYKKTNLTKAHEALKLAKSQNRPVRRANPNECEFSREIAIVKNNQNNDLVTTEQVAKMLGKSNYVVFKYRDLGIFKVHSQIKQTQYYLREDIDKHLDDLYTRISESMTILEACKYIKISAVCFRDYVFKEKIKSFKIYGKKYVKIEDVKEFKETYFKNT